MTMCDKELIVGYLYDEVDAAERRTMEAHLLSCGGCRAELKELRSVRTTLTAWAPPAPQLEFQVIRGPQALPPPSRNWSIAPAWGLAAAAVLVLSVASAIANVEVKYGADGLTVRTGAARQAPATAAVQAPTAVAAQDVTARRELQAISQRVHDLESAAETRPILASMHTSAAPTAPVDLRAVRQLISDAENRQEQELARRISQVLRDFEGARRVDLDRTQRALAEMQGVSDTTIIRQREMENHVLRVMQQPK
jgi:hypothetical protein